MNFCRWYAVRQAGVQVSKTPRHGCHHTYPAELVQLLYTSFGMEATQLLKPRLLGTCWSSGLPRARWQQRQAHSTTHGERPVLVKQVFETFLELRYGLLVTWKATHSATHARHYDAPSSRLLAAAVSAAHGTTTSLRIAPEMQGDDGDVPTHKAQLQDTCVPSLYTVSSWRTLTVRRDE